MDYVVNINGVDIVIEQNESNENRSRLLEYYSKLLQANGIDFTSDKENALKKIVGNMTEYAASEKLSSLDEGQLNRLVAYASAINQLTKDEKELADALEEVIEATLEDDEFDSILVNGNKFVYEKGSIDIKAYMQKLYLIGEEKKGYTWTIYVDEEGELVIY